MKSIEQQVLYKAQLFVPNLNRDINIKYINKQCITGVYYRREELLTFSNCQFYIPTKINWLIKVQHAVDWLGYQDFYNLINSYLDEQRSPLIWIKHPQGDIERCFVVWW